VIAARIASGRKRDYKTHCNTVQHTATHILMKRYVFIRTFMHAFIHKHTHTCIHTYIPTYILTYIHTYIQTNIHATINAYTHTYIHMYICTYIRPHIICTNAYLCIHRHTRINTYTYAHVPTTCPHLRTRDMPIVILKCSANQLCWHCISGSDLILKCSASTVDTALYIINVNSNLWFDTRIKTKTSLHNGTNTLTWKRCHYICRWAFGAPGHRVGCKCGGCTEDVPVGMASSGWIKVIYKLH